MSLTIHTANPKALLAKFVAAIEQDEAKGRINTWEKNSKGAFTHKADQWAKEAWFKPVIEPDRLKFTIQPPPNKTVNVVVYAYYHGHLTETFLAHFYRDFTGIEASAPNVG